MCIIDPRQCLRKGKLCSHIEMIEKRLYKKKGEKVGKKGGCYVCVPTFIRVDPSG